MELLNRIMATWLSLFANLRLGLLFVLCEGAQFRAFIDESRTESIIYLGFNENEGFRSAVFVLIWIK